MTTMMRSSIPRSLTLSSSTCRRRCGCPCSRQLPADASVRRQSETRHVRSTGGQPLRTRPGRDHRLRVSIRGRRARAGGVLSIELRQDDSVVRQVRRDPAAPIDARLDFAAGINRGHGQLPGEVRAGGGRRDLAASSARGPRPIVTPVWVDNTAASLDAIAHDHDGDGARTGRNPRTCIETRHTSAWAGGCGWAAPRMSRRKSCCGRGLRP